MNELENEIAVVSDEILNLRIQKGVLSEIKNKDFKTIKKFILIEFSLFIKTLKLTSLIQQLNSPFIKNLK